VDPQCSTDPACLTCKPEICNNGVDDSCNALVDCADPSCALDAACRFTVEVCDNFKDDNANGLTDCDDPSCFATDWCKNRHENCNTAYTVTASGTYFGDTSTFWNHTVGSCGGQAGEAVFRIVLTAPARLRISSTGTKQPPFDSTVYLRRGACSTGYELGCDDDSGGAWAGAIDVPVAKAGTYYAFMDGFTYGDLGKYQFNVTIDYMLKEDCSNKTDDDGDGYADCADKDCAGLAACAGATPELGVGACTDGIDNDKDGLVDCADPDCRASKFYKTECCNGIDDNGNGIVDEDACHCAPDRPCDRGICNWNTTEACGPRCNTIVGASICPAIAPGSICDSSSGLCAWTGG
jgi:hypothetical protein